MAGGKLARLLLAVGGRPPPADARRARDAKPAPAGTSSAHNAAAQPAAGALTRSPAAGAAGAAGDAGAAPGAKVRKRRRGGVGRSVPPKKAPPAKRARREAGPAAAPAAAPDGGGATTEALQAEREQLLRGRSAYEALMTELARERRSSGGAAGSSGRLGGGGGRSKELRRQLRQLRQEQLGGSGSDSDSDSQDADDAEGVEGTTGSGTASDEGDSDDSDDSDGSDGGDVRLEAMRGAAAAGRRAKGGAANDDGGGADSGARQWQGAAKAAANGGSTARRGGGGSGGDGKPDAAETEEEDAEREQQAHVRAGGGAAVAGPGAAAAAGPAAGAGAGAGAPPPADSWALHLGRHLRDVEVAALEGPPPPYRDAPPAEVHGTAWGPHARWQVRWYDTPPRTAAAGSSVKSDGGSGAEGVLGLATLPAAPPTLPQYGVKERLVTRWRELRQEAAAAATASGAAAAANGHAPSAPAASPDGDFASPQQRSLFALLNAYADVHLPARPYPTDPGVGAPDPLLDAVLLHALNHVAKTADRVRKNNAALEAAEAARAAEAAAARAREAEERASGKRRRWQQRLQRRPEAPGQQAGAQAEQQQQQQAAGARVGASPGPESADGDASDDNDDARAEPRSEGGAEEREGSGAEARGGAGAETPGAAKAADGGAATAQNGDATTTAAAASTAAGAAAAADAEAGAAASEAGGAASPTGEPPAAGPAGDTATEAGAAAAAGTGDGAGAGAGDGGRDASATAAAGTAANGGGSGVLGACEGGVPRDQGFTRPKVLLLTPQRNLAFRVVRRLVALAIKETRTDSVQGKEKFVEQFTDPDEAQDEADLDAATRARLAAKPADHRALFTGNMDDHFRLGIRITRGAVRLFAELETSDIIVASPVGLATRVNEEKRGEAAAAPDFLSSIELLLIDRADLAGMQNWEHIELIASALNKLPRGGCGDIMRVREWYLSGYGRHYRQTVLLSSYASPDGNALMARACANHAGSAVLRAEHAGVLGAVIPQVRQLFERFPGGASPAAAGDARFEFFSRTVWPRLKDSAAKGLLIFVASYYDFLRLRNALAAQDDATVAAISEYTPPKEVTRARAHFFHGQRRVLLYTERAHFYHRYRIRGIKDVLFYGLPEHAHYYPELLNLLEEGGAAAAAAAAAGSRAAQQHATVTALFCKWDVLALQRLVGTSRAARMLRGESGTFMFC